MAADDFAAPQPCRNAVKLIEDRADEFVPAKAETGQPQMIVDMMQYGAALSGLQFYLTAADKSPGADIRDGPQGRLEARARLMQACGGGLEALFLACNKRPSR